MADKDDLESNCWFGRGLMKIVFATGNSHKLQELREIAGDCDIEFVLPPQGFDPVENGETFEENSLIKAQEAARVSGMMALADDSGLCVEALNGAPGIHSARYAETPQARIDKLLDVLDGIENRKAKFVCAMTLVDKNGEILFKTTGECYGEIAKSQSGTNGFGYDPIFVIHPLIPSSQKPDTYCTMADMSEEAKNKISHRSVALRKVLEYLNKFSS